jgi:hypothetical protein
MRIPKITEVFLLSESTWSSIAGNDDSVNLAIRRSKELSTFRGSDKEVVKLLEERLREFMENAELDGSEEDVQDRIENCRIVKLIAGYIALEEEEIPVHTSPLYFMKGWPEWKLESELSDPEKQWASSLWREIEGKN